MPSESGYSNQKKFGNSQFKTIHNVGSSKYGEYAAQMYLYDVTPAAIALVSVAVDEEDPKLVYLEIPSHSARVGDIVRIQIPAPLAGWELEVVEVVDADILAVYFLSEINGVRTLPEVGDEVKIGRWITAKADAEGALTTSSGPVQFIRNGITATVTQDDVTPANNRPLPAGLYIVKDGVVYPVTKDTATPANTVGVPVEIVAASGTPINITAGDIDIHTSSEGVNFDSMRVGDGSGVYLLINPDGSINTNDADVLAELQQLNLVDFATEAKQDAIITELQSIEGKDFATEVTQQDVLSELQQLNLVDFATEAKQDAEAVLIGAVNETAPATDTASSGLNGRLQRIAQRLTSLIALLPTSLGQKPMADSLAVTMASDQDAIAVTTSTTDISLSGSITTVNGNVTSNTLNGTSTMTIQVTGTYTGALTVQGTINGTTWINIPGLKLGTSGALASSIASSAVGIWQVDVSGYGRVRVIALGAVTGSASVNLRISPANVGVFINSALPSGSNTIGSLSANQSINMNQIAGTTPDVNVGAAGAGTQRVVLASNSPGVAPLTASFQEINNLTTSVQTFTAPANAKWAKVYADDTNVANIRVKIGGTATVSSGIQFQPGRSEDYSVGGDISVIAESGSNQKICVQFGE